MASSSPLTQPEFTWMRDLLWPTNDGVEPVARYAVLSRGDRPRLVVPLGSKRAAATALGRVSNDEPRMRRMLRRMLAVSANAGVLLPLLRHRFVATASDDGSLEAYLAAAVRRDRVELAVTIGPPRPNRKPVIQIMSGTGETIGYAKVGWNGLTRQLVAQETEVLRSVDRTGLRRLRLPRVIHAGSFRDLDLLVVGALAPGPDESVEVRDPTEAEIDDLRSLRSERQNPLVADMYFSRLLERIANLGAASGSLASQAELVADELGDSPILFAGGHGDWTPWNMVATNRHLLVWDWERAVSEVPFPLDVIHYHSQRAWFRLGLPLPVAIADGVSAARRALRDAGREPDNAGPLGRLYLVDLAVRYAENALAGTDELLSDQHGEVMRTLDSYQPGR